MMQAHEHHQAMLVLSESQVAQSTIAFDKAWASEASMVILPDALVDAFWVQARLGLVEPDLQTRHLLMWCQDEQGRPRLSIARKSSIVDQAKCIGEAQALEGICRVLITLPLSEPFSLVNQWIWAMRKRAQRVCRTGIEDLSALRDELSSLAPTLLCLDRAQAAAITEAFAGQVFFGVKRICLVNVGDARTLIPALRALFPWARCYQGQGLIGAMSFVSMQVAAPGEGRWGQALPGVEFERLSSGQLGVRAPYFALAKIDDHALSRFDQEHCFELPARMSSPERLAS